MSPAEEEDLCRSIIAGDSHAAHKLILSNLRFVISVAKQYQTNGISLGDLISEGNLGLIKAACRFDHTKGFRFISYAVWWIRQAITSAIEEQTRLIHLPLNQVALMNQYIKVMNRKEQELQRKASIREIAEEMGTYGERLSELLHNTQVSTSLNQPLGEEGCSCLHDRLAHKGLAPDRHLMKDSVAVDICQALKILDQRERDMISLCFGLSGNNPFRLEEIADRYNLSIEHTRRLKDGALIKLRNSSFASRLKTCFLNADHE